MIKKNKWAKTLMQGRPRIFRISSQERKTWKEKDEYLSRSGV